MANQGFKNNDVESSGALPGKETDDRGSRFAQDLPGAAQGDRQKFNDMKNAGQAKKTVAPKAYPGEGLPTTRGNPADNGDLGLAGHSDIPPKKIKSDKA